MNLAYIQKNLFIGGAAMSKRPSTVYGYGIRSVVQLSPTIDFEWIADFEVHKLPVPDEFNLTDEQITEATTTIHRLIKEKPAVLIQCQDGDNLSAILAIAYLIEYHDYSLANAFVRVLTRSYDVFPAPELLRKLIDHYTLPYPADAIPNIHFMETLIAEAQSAISPVSHGLHVGGVSAISRMEQVREMGISAVLRLDRLHRTAGQWADDFVLLDMPVQDGAALPIDLLRKGTAFIHEQVQAGNKVLVHCQMGVSRAPTFVMAYLVEYGGMSLGEAYRLVFQARPIINPSSLLIQSLVQHFALPHDLDAVTQPSFLEDLA